MLLKLRNGTVWSLVDKPQAKYVKALNARRLEPYNFALSIVGSLIATLPFFGILVATYSNILPIDANWRLPIGMLCISFVWVVAVNVHHALSFTPDSRKLVLEQIERGFVDELVPATSIAFALIEPAIDAAGDDPTRCAAITEYFREVQRTSTLESHWTKSWMLGYEYTHTQQTIIHAAARHLVETVPEFTALLHTNLTTFEQEMRTAYIAALRAAIEQHDAEISHHQDKIASHAEAIDDLNEYICDLKVTLNEYQGVVQE